MCERLIVMQNGVAVEALETSKLAAHAVATDYTRALLAASEGYRRDPLASGAAFARERRPARG
jgi:peptide/nickel transport system ATP-binding protein